MVIGAGQLGKALRELWSDVVLLGRDDLDISDEIMVRNFDWSEVDVIINAAAYTNVDGAETETGKMLAYKSNVDGVRNLTEISKKNNILLIHISSDYVFDGTKKGEYLETDHVNPINVYGETKAKGDEMVASLDRYYLVRSTWVVGDGKNFVRTMVSLGEKGINPKVVSDQVGRPTFTDDLAKFIKYLIDSECDHGVYNFTNSGQTVSWAEFAKIIFAECGYNNEVTPISTSEYFFDKPQAAKRPLNSVLSLEKAVSTGFLIRDWKLALSDYLKKEKA